MTNRLCTIAATFACLPLFAFVAQAAPVDFVKDIQPILQSACMDCHGETKPKGRLRLDSKALTLKGGSTGPGIIPGNARESILVHRIRGLNDEDQMPLDRDPLTEQQIKLIETWIDQGAVWPDSASKHDAKIDTHWSFIKPTRPAAPSVKLQGWARNPIDNFILARLERENVPPSPEADKATLIRRLSLDLIGLPPTPEEVDAFLSDTSPDAYDRLVDRLLASPHYGERWARKWLDLARYADTNGYEKDRPRVMWPYRDWLINALNADMPFDQFTVEQIAGDMLESPTLQQRIATGFHRNTMINEEGGIDPLEYRFHAMVDRVHVTSTAWLGLTMSCAQCHTHKYDPITHKEYYSFMAFLDNADEPEMEVPTPDFKAKEADALAKVEKLTRDLPGKFPFDEVRWEAPTVASVVATTSDPVEKLPDNVIHFPAPGPEKDSYTIELESPAGVDIQQLRLEALKNNDQGPGRAKTNDNFVLTNVFVTVTPKDGGDSQIVKLVKATADYNQNGFPPDHAIDDKPNTGWAIDGGGKRTRTATFHFEEPLSFPAGAKWTVKLDQQFGGHHTLRRLRLSLGEKIHDDRPVELRRAEALARAFAAWQEQNAPRAVTWTPLKPEQIESGKPTLTLLDDHSILASGDFTKSDTYTLTFRNLPANITAFRLEALTHDALPRKGPGRIYYEGPFGDFFLSEFSAAIGDAPVKFSKAIQSFAAGDNTAQKSIDGDPQSGWSINGRQGQNHYAVFSLAEPLNAGTALAAASPAHVASVEVQGEGSASTPKDEPPPAPSASTELKLRLLSERYYVAAMGRFRISVTTDSRALTTPTAVPPDVELALATSPDNRTKDQQDLIFRHWLTITPDLNDARKEIDALRNNLPKPVTTLVMQERPRSHPRPTPLRHRGEFLQARDVVEPGIPAVLPQLPADAPKNRLGLAKWLVSKDNPLTARVVVNRHWSTFFNRGLVRTVEDFGIQGEKPSHPQLLDYLAVQFMDAGWSMKKLHKLIVTSSTYRQQSRVTPDLLQRDPQNVLLARATRYRLEAEILRDAALRAAGLLTTKLGGPSVYPPQHPSITTEGAYGPLPWNVSTGPDRFRRSLYTFAKRTAPFALFANFDAPSGEACTARREVTNTPLQALSLLNDQIFLEAAQSMGAYLASISGSDEDKLKTLFRRCLARNPDAEEVKLLTDFLTKQRERLKTGSLDAPKLAGSREGDPQSRATWTTVARAVMNVDEMVTRN